MLLKLYQNYKWGNVQDKFLFLSIVRLFQVIQIMGVLHSSFLPEHHDTHGKLYFLQKLIIDSDGGIKYIGYF